MTRVYLDKLLADKIDFYKSKNNHLKYRITFSMKMYKDVFYDENLTTDEELKLIKRFKARFNTEWNYLKKIKQSSKLYKEIFTINNFIVQYTELPDNELTLAIQGIMRELGVYRGWRYAPAVISKAKKDLRFLANNKRIAQTTLFLLGKPLREEDAKKLEK